MRRPNVQLSSTGRSVPARVMTNYDFAAIGIETTHEWVMERTGISERHIAGPSDSTCSMGAAASRVAMQRAGVQPGEIDIIILSTATPDRLLPATAVDIQAALGATRAAAFDISAACCGFLFGLSMAEGFIQSGAAETVLLVSSEKMSAITDWSDRATCVLFGDGAGAAVLRRSQKGRGILSTYMRSDGTLANLLYRPEGGAATPMSPAVLEARTHLVHMAGREVFKHAVRSMAESAARALDLARINGGDIDLFVPHQANRRIIEATAKHANISMDRVYMNIDRFGNTSSASIPIALDEAIQRGKVGEGSLVLMVAFGAGFTWASSVVRL
ncbi:MAG: beta-ketoacyl-ACP synthase III [Gemmatimonadaceae bacterium]